mgnify:CR=1 FL=1
MNRFIFIIFIMLQTALLQAQAQDIDKLYNKARNRYATGHFEEARDIYKKLVKAKPDDFVFNYELAMLYFHELNDRSASIPYFETARDVMKDTVADLFNYLGQAYQDNLQYDKAIESFNQYSAIPPKEGVIRVSVKRYIEECRQEKARLNEIKNKRNQTTPSGIQVINFGPVVNSENDDLSPIQYNNKLIFTSSSSFDYVFNEYIRKPYQTIYEGDEFQEPKPLVDIPYDKGLVVDPNWHQHISSMTIDGDLATVIYEGDIWIVEKKGQNWAEPRELARKVNRSRDNAYAALSGKGDRMVLVLQDRKTKKYNLYQTVKNAEGEWKEPIKLNSNINSDNNEHYPYISADGYTLYFSSDKPGGKGKYDIYKSQLQENNEWGPAKLLKSPINSSGNDITYKHYKAINKAYFSSDRAGGFGQYDLYEVIY